MQLGIRCLVLSVEVITGKTPSVITCNHAIRIDHWHYFEHDSFPKFNRLLRLARNELYEALHYEAGIGFTGMDPSTDNHVLFIFMWRYVSFICEL